MCNRFGIIKDIRVIAAAFGVDGEPGRSHPRPDIRPTDRILAIAIGRSGRRQLIDARWGLVPHFAREETPGGQTTNARSETIAEKPTWKPSFLAQGGRGGRCLIPFDVFYEWSGEKGSKVMHTITVPSNRPIAFAGLWAAWPKVPANIPKPYLSAAIVTTAANGQMANIHDRMPAILDEDSFALWLGEASATDSELLDLLKPWPGQLQIDPLPPAAAATA